MRVTAWTARGWGEGAPVVTVRDRAAVTVMLTALAWLERREVAQELADRRAIAETLGYRRPVREGRGIFGWLSR